MRTLAIVIAIALAAAYAAHTLFVMRTAWGAPLAILFAGGGVISIAVVLRNAPRPTARRARGAPPTDPGFPRSPLGAPYRGPH